MNQTNMKISAPQASRRLRNLYDFVNIQDRLIQIAQDIEAYGEVGEPERKKIEFLYLESRDMTEALKELLEGISHDT